MQQVYRKRWVRLKAEFADKDARMPVQPVATRFFAFCRDEVTRARMFDTGELCDASTMQMGGVTSRSVYGLECSIYVSIAEQDEIWLPKKMADGHRVGWCVLYF